MSVPYFETRDLLDALLQREACGITTEEVLSTPFGKTLHLNIASRKLAWHLEAEGKMSAYSTIVGDAHAIRREMLERARTFWMPMIAKRWWRAGIGAAMRLPAWSLLICPVTRAFANLAGIPNARLARQHVRKDGLTRLQSYDGGRTRGRERHGEGVLTGSVRGPFLDLKLDVQAIVRFPILTVTCANEMTIIGIRGVLPDTIVDTMLNQGIHRMFDLFSEGTPAGDAVMRDIWSMEGTTYVTIKNLREPLVEPPKTRDVRWMSIAHHMKDGDFEWNDRLGHTY